ncbi:MAG: hypothetical protein ACOCV1_01690 [Bacillota bacterium]
MVKENKKKIIIPIVVILSLLFGLYVFNLPTVENTYYSSNVGNVKIITKTYNEIGEFFYTIFNIVEQKAYFYDTSLEPGESTTIKDVTFATNLDDLWGIQRFTLRIYKDGIVEDTTGMSYAKPEGGLHTFTYTFTPYEEGEYTLKTYYFPCEYDNIMDQIAGTNCRVRLFDDWQESGTNTLTVESDEPEPEPEPEPCYKDPYWDNWKTYSNKDWGKIEKRDYYKVDSDCNYYKDKTEYKTICDSGYQIVNTNGQTTANEKTSCEEIYIEEDCNIIGCEGDLVCGDDGNCYERECSEDITSDCWDGSTIVTSYCNEGKLEETGNQCPEEPEFITVYRLKNNRCKEIEIAENERVSIDYDSLEECEENIVGPTPDESSSVWMLIGIIIAVLVILTLIILIILRIIKKKNNIPK